MCKCASYNRPDLGGDMPQAPMRMPDGLGGRLVMVDRCIAWEIKALWDSGIMTYGSCCGHNGKLGRPTVCVSGQPEEAVAIVGHRMDVLCAVDGEDDLVNFSELMS